MNNFFNPQTFSKFMNIFLIHKLFIKSMNVFKFIYFVLQIHELFSIFFVFLKFMQFFYLWTFFNKIFIKILRPFPFLTFFSSKFMISLKLTKKFRFLFFLKVNCRRSTVKFQLVEERGRESTGWRMREGDDSSERSSCFVGRPTQRGAMSASSLLSA